MIYDFPSRQSFRAFLGYYRFPLLQFGWVVWIAFWAGNALGGGHVFSLWLNGIALPFMVLVNVLTWHTRTVDQSKTHYWNLREIRRWMEHNGYNPDEPPPWLH